MHTTLGLAINENEPLLLRDFQKLLERLAPGDAGYEHDDFARRYEISDNEPVNGHAHCRQLLLTGFATLLVEEGQLVLGRWQSVFAVELDGPRHRELAMQLDGDFEEKKAGYADSDLIELELARQLMVDPDPVAAPMRCAPPLWPRPSSCSTTRPWFTTTMSTSRRTVAGGPQSRRPKAPNAPSPSVTITSRRRPA
jgi:secondary thiamine-phosphate synthase enzyme